VTLLLRTVYLSLKFYGSAGGTVASGKISSARSIHGYPIFISFGPQPSLYYEEYVYIYTYLNAYRLYELPLLTNHTASRTFFQEKEGCEVLT
jgi:hypothetical protein